MLNFAILVAAIVCGMFVYTVSFLMVFMNKRIMKWYLKKCMEMTVELTEDEDYNF